MTAFTDAGHKDLTLYEVFVRSKQGLDHKHVGSLHAADATHALGYIGGCAALRDARSYAA